MCACEPPPPASPAGDLHREPDPFHERACPKCGYWLRGLTSDRCPECGTSVAGVLADIPQIPWVHRRKLGRVRAYWSTVWLVVFRTQRFCDEVVRPVSLPDAQRFALATAMHACIAVLVGHALWFVEDRAGLVSTYGSLGLWLGAIGGIAVVLWLISLTLLPTDLFRPKKLSQALADRAVALAHYGCAPMALWPLAVLLSYAAIKIAQIRARSNTLETLFIIISGFLAIGVLWFSWPLYLRIARRVLPGSRSAWRVFFCVPLFALLATALILVGLPAAAFYVGVMVDSLRP